MSTWQDPPVCRTRSPFPPFTPLVKLILIATSAVYLVQLVLAREWGLDLVNWFGLWPRQALIQGHLWQFFSYMFLHGPPFHLLFNLIVLWFFGSEVETVYQTRGLLRLYVAGGVAGALLHVVFKLNVDQPCIGASAAVYAVVAAYICLYPNRMLYFLFFLPIKASWILYGFLFITLMMMVSNSVSGASLTDAPIAHAAHLGGMLAGMIYVGRSSPLPLARGLSQPLYALSTMLRRRRSGLRVHREDDPEPSSDLREEVDRILDKVNAQGLDSLTWKERRTLKQASEKFQSEGKGSQEPRYH